MNKKYIDFVPTNKKAEAPRAQVVMPKKQPEAAVVTRTTITRTTVTGVSTPAPSSARTAQIPTARSKMVRPSPRPAQTPQVRPKRPTPVEPQIVTPVAKKMPTDKVPPMGVVEDLNARFVKRDVPKRPLSTKPNRVATTPAFNATSEVAAAKQQKVKARSVAKQAKKPANQPAKEPVKKPESKEKSTYKTPKSPFINQHKVKKRPLSGNIYKHEIKEAVKEEPKGPVTIIAKPEKDKHIGIIVTIIITIILGAAAGTVAFLLLPK